jgi:hypothetical protein
MYLIHIIVTIVQYILHYLGWIGIVLGVVAFLFGNRERAIELGIGGFGFIVLKYIIGFIYIGLVGLTKKSKE